MAVVNPVIFQISGYQNSGKTTFVEKIIPSLKKEGITVATIKHHGHGGKPSIVEGKDSGAHIDAGAVAALVEGDGRLLIHGEKSNWTLEEKLQIIKAIQPEVILIEGHKHEDFPKAVLLRTKRDADELLSLSNIQVIYYWDEALVRTKNLMDIPVFHINDPSGMAWLVDYLQSEADKRYRLDAADEEEM